MTLMSVTNCAVAGLDTLDKIAKSDPQKMEKVFVEFVERTKFDGTLPPLSEAAFAVKLAKCLPRSWNTDSTRA